MLHVILRAVVLIGLIGFAWFAWSTLRYGSLVYDHLTDIDRLIARTSFISLFFAQLDAEGKRLRSQFVWSIGRCFAAALFIGIVLAILHVSGGTLS